MGKKNRKKKANNVISMGPTPKSKYTPPPPMPRCHTHKVQQVIEANEGKTRIWAGSLTSMREAVDSGWIDPVLAINMSGMDYDFNAIFPVTGSPEALNLLPEGIFKDEMSPPCALIDIDWEDGGIPYGLSKAWWEAFSKSVMMVEGDIALCCIGGHGRTGTLLALMLHFGELGLDHACPVEYMREHYCDSAMETDAQAKYIERMTGRTVKALPSDGGRFPYNVVSGSVHKSAATSANTFKQAGPGEADYAFCQTGAEIPLSPEQEAYITSLDGQTHTVSYEEAVAAEDTKAEKLETDFVIDGVHYADEEDFIAHEEEHNAMRAAGIL
jgi:hypothetical protein